MVPSNRQEHTGRAAARTHGEPFEEYTFSSGDAAKRFERRATDAIRHATLLGLFTKQEAAPLLDRVHAVTRAGRRVPIVIPSGGIGDGVSG